ncbi:TPA: hypothetical protein QCU10_005810 [Bacillus anthracis]|nr:hypothetical protein [Bacillus cereus biovar anthracis]HDR6230930.1 hypothetical protein [Bacillus cereus biovar anthracis]HDR6240457.1 hypothetical protein [Bacillus cereus biovar anthracis]HDR6252401.1 hypothetical protein [Bacillus cereus biovar anthracis]HDR6254186.1 hypothetical protein [Bacillus cereus biovar anthracis]
MAKKKRYLQKEVKTVEVYRKPTLQEAWDVVSEHLAFLTERDDNISFFIDLQGTHAYPDFRKMHQDNGHCIVHRASSGEVLLRSSEKVYKR